MWEGGGESKHQARAELVTSTLQARELGSPALPAWSHHEGRPPRPRGGMNAQATP